MRLINKIVTVFWPSLVVVVLFSSFLIMSNEIYHFETIVKTQQLDELYGIAFSDRNVEYKLHNLLKRDPELVIIGTSRVMQFRSGMFDEYVTYNAGGIVRNISHFRPLLYKLISDGNPPKLVIVGLDQYFFNESWHQINPADVSYLNQLHYKPNLVFPDRRKLFEAFVSDPGVFLSGSIFKSDNLGLLGRVYNQGFRVDGSYYYGRYYDLGMNNDTDFIDTIYRIENGVSRFQYADNYNPRAVKELEAFLLLANQHEIFVIGFMPPYAPTINELMSLTGNYEYINKVTLEINSLFEQYGFKYFDFTTMGNTKDNDFVDGFHGDEMVYGLIAREIIDFLGEHIN
jgi:hypothetical protein